MLLASEDAWTVSITGPLWRIMYDLWSHEDAGDAVTISPPALEITGPRAVDGGCELGKPGSKQAPGWAGFCSRV